MGDDQISSNLNRIKYFVLGVVRDRFHPAMKQETIFRECASASGFKIHPDERSDGISAQGNINCPVGSVTGEDLADVDNLESRSKRLEFLVMPHVRSQN